MAYIKENISGRNESWYKRKKEIWDIYPDPKDFRKLLKEIKKHPINKKFQKRDYMIFVILGNLGLRIGELVLCEKNHFRMLDNNPPISNVPSLKKRKKGQLKSIYTHWKVADKIKEYIDGLYRTDTYLFPGFTEEGHISIRQVYNIIISYFRQFGFKENYTPHSIRHMVGTMTYDKTNDPAFVRDQLGHSTISGNLGATNIYIHTSQERARINLKKIGYLL